MTQLRDEPASSGTPAVAPALGAKAGDFEVLDLFCGAGGAAMGIHRALIAANIPHKIIGVDIVNQPRYPFCFRLANAMHYPLENFDFIWASPPCQKFSALKTMKNYRQHSDLLTPTRERLPNIPTCIENVPGSPLRKGSTMLCGTMFGNGIVAKNAELRRHRWFETNFPLLAPPCQHISGTVCGVYGGHGRDRRRTVTVVSKGGGHYKRGGQGFNVVERREAMGIDWMKDYELSQAVPPAYSEFIFRQFLAQLHGSLVTSHQSPIT